MLTNISQLQLKLKHKQKLLYLSLANVAEAVPLLI